MKLFRYMSKNEFNKLINGETLKNDKKHTGFTDSVGFCFMEGEEGTAEYCYDFLSGIVSNEVLVLFETDKELKKGYGRYADPYGSFFDTIMKTEYSITEYNKDIIKPLKYCTNFDEHQLDDEEWIFKEIGE